MLSTNFSVEQVGGKKNLCSNKGNKSRESEFIGLIGSLAMMILHVNESMLLFQFLLHSED